MAPPPYPARYAVAEACASAPLAKRFSLPILAVLGVFSIVGGGRLVAPAADPPFTAAEQVTRTVAFQQASPIVLPPVQPDERAGALLSMNLQDRPQQASELPRDLVWLTLWDDCAEDGDIVSVLSEEFGISIPLTHQPVRLAVPKPTDNLLSVHGLFDGGGGITVALSTAHGPVPLPVMTPGQTLVVPVR